VDRLLAFVGAASDLGPYQGVFLARLETAREAVADGAAACAGGATGEARSALARVDRQLIAIRWRLRTRRARKLIPPDVAAELARAARGVSADLRVLRRSLDCSNGG
jgi:hypothetical protein